ncbi:MaoC family dehydratase [Planosporangium mesophilum]|uniref:Acyl dehydratase n=1 Tax=Planosporangium mesophilum TaxID=689768 RepID=A0A8J3X0E5_9ACTN|nr:MaoC family dehydratase [Planosporangium mesophilum]NJC86291.1 acyl dehydratase [Planosporangium mesophilum]GII23300.1 acyl dehydratase [Planosporangium mesophilum]
MTAELVVGGPYLDDLRVGDVFDTAPAVTLTDGLAAAHHAIVGSRLRLALDERLSRRVTGGDQRFADPALVWDIAIGQSTLATQRVLANLFYRGFAFGRAPSIGDTLYTRTEVVGLKQNRSRPTGLAALRITTTDQDGRTVLDFWRCAMLPLRDARAQTGHADDLSGIGTPPGPAVLAGVTAGWDLAGFRDHVAGPHFADLHAGTTWRIDGGDVVSSAPELARLTGNLAAVHHDRTAAEGDRRLVYGGHTIGLALTQATRALPNLVTVVGWHGCDHTGPVHEGDTLFSTVTVENTEPLPGGGGLVHLWSLVRARESATDHARDVLDWRYVAVLA